jgi:DNA/RNA endonuclease YhcR with UshA esterase domain
MMVLSISVLAQTNAPHALQTSEAKNHIGERATVCGVVESARYSTSGRQPTSLNLDKPYLNQLFTVLIWGANRAKFGKPEETYKGKRICVTGTIETYQNVPEIILDDPSQLAVQDAKTP